MQKYITSPYLRYYQKDENRIYNMLTDRLLALSDMEISVLERIARGESWEICKELCGEAGLRKMIRRTLLVDPNTIWDRHCIRHVEIETSTICNWKCEYCPVRYDNERKQHFMDMGLFTKILDDAVAYQKVRYITINSYNEPTLGDRFYSYTAEIFKRGLILILYTNASHFDLKKILYLKQHKNQLRRIVMNLPSLDRDRFENMTASHDYDKVIRAINTALEYGLDIGFSIQGYGDEHKKDLQEISQKYPDVPVIINNTTDRAGVLKGDYHKHVHLSEPYLQGCSMSTATVVVNVEGKICMCCNDYRREVTYGDITRASLSEILSSKRYRDLRKAQWGAIPADDNFLCRRCLSALEFSEHEMVSGTGPTFLK